MQIYGQSTINPKKAFFFYHPYITLSFSLDRICKDNTLIFNRLYYYHPIVTYAIILMYLKHDAGICGIYSQFTTNNSQSSMKTNFGNLLLLTFLLSNYLK